MSREADWSHATDELIRHAIREDLSDGVDLTADLVIGGGAIVSARIQTRAKGVICGLALASRILRHFSEHLQSPLEFIAAESVSDGSRVDDRAVVGYVSGPLRAVLTAERTLLNFLCRMSGVATLTRMYVDRAAAANPAASIYDTRKTIPGWRELDKYAVRCGGGRNHRMGLFDAVLVKDNHIAGVAPGELGAVIAAMLKQIRGRPAFVEVEVDTLEQLRSVLGIEGVRIILLDNFALDDMRAAVGLRDSAGLRGRVELEASGGVTLETVGSIAATGIDRIAVGAITHSAPAQDIGLDL